MRNGRQVTNAVRKIDTFFFSSSQDFGFVVGAFSDVAHKMDACDVASEDEDEVGCEKRYVLHFPNPKTV